MTDRRLDYIDALRGVAIAGVVLIHSGQIVPGLPGWLQSFTTYGGNGVELFFLLSALTLASVYTGRNVSTPVFLTRRFFRIAPMFYLGALFYLWLLGTGPQRFAPQGIGLRQILLTFAFLHGWARDSFNSVVPGGWSIANEAMFYLCFLPLLRTLTTLRRTAIAFILAAFFSRAVTTLIPYLLGRDKLTVVFAQFSPPAHLVGFIGGFVVYRLVEALHQGNVVSKAHADRALVLVTFVLLGVAASNNGKLTHFIIADCLFIVLVTAAAISQPRALVNRAMIHLGRVSYSVYILHFAVVHALEEPLTPMLEGLPVAAKVGVVFAVVLAVSTLAASITYRIIERPMIAVGKFVSKREGPAMRDTLRKS